MTTGTSMYSNIRVKKSIVTQSTNTIATVMAYECWPRASGDVGVSDVACHG